MSKKVLLTGAGGFIGRQCIGPLLETGYDVHAVYRTRHPATEDGTNVRWHRCDLLDAGRPAGLIRDIRPTHVMHLAWITTPGAYWTSLENTEWIRASLELVQQGVKQGVQRVLMAGSCAEYDWNHTGLFSERTTPLRPGTLYGASKHCLQQLSSLVCRQAGVSHAWGRLFFVYGPHEHPDRLVPSVIGSLSKGETARCTHGQQVRDFIYVKDAVSALVSLLESTVEGPVNIGSGRPVNLKSVVERIAEKMGCPDRVEFGALTVSEDSPGSLVADIGRLTGEIGWHPAYSLDRGLEEILGETRCRS